MIDAHDHVTPDLADVTPRWLHLLREAVKADARGCSGVAAKIGRSRMYVSQAIHGLNKGPMSPDFQRRVLAAFGQGRIECPHLKKDIALGECQAFAAVTWAQVANTGYERLDHWKACDQCPHNPSNQKKPQGDQP